jgi:5-carboxymethyl-2-hydroxymuconate isomerase
MYQQLRTTNPSSADVFVPEEPTYDDFVRVSKEIMKGRTPDQQKEVVLDVLKALLPDQVTKQFR